ncbi:MAG TPA: glycerol-3-phosphate dehydrogenase, partial [Thermomicrobiales bacterium]|nr:glycerol-3-phosphate dehydrogenase [Thermomicrobiales bacterium]
MEPARPDSTSPASGERYDLLVIGGGINGVGVARDAAGRGLKVLLCEQADLGAATSSASSKLLHGGLRYLEQFQFRMVRHALAEREVLLAAAPHIVTPLRFVLPHNRKIRPYWMIRVGIWLYDHLARRNTLPGSTGLDLRQDIAGQPLRERFRRGFEYSDCWVDDARLVVLTAIDARQRGATILTRTRCVAATRVDGGWQVELEDTISGERRCVMASVIVNAAGPWAEGVARQILGVESRYRSRLVKGSHIVVPRMVDHGKAYILQNDDKRIVFVLPFEDDFTMIGTTDVPYDGDPFAAEIDAEETDYLLAVVNDHFRRQLSADNIVWSFSGVRPLYDDGSRSAAKVSRDYILETHAAPGIDGPAALTIWGGKLTGFRLLAEDVLEQLRPRFPGMPGRWTAGALLPGGNLHPPGIEQFTTMLTQVYDWLPPKLARAYARRYGNLAHTVLGNASSLQRHGEELAPGLYTREVDYLVRHEWARTADDILWRRTKLGLHATPTDVQRVEDYITQLPQATGKA